MAIEYAVWADKYKTVLQLAQGECAQQVISCRSGCRLKGERPPACGYFERALLPGVPTVDGRKPLLEAYARMQTLHEGMRPRFATAKARAIWSAYLERDVRRCPDCGVGLGKGKRVCPKCLKARQRARQKSGARRERPD